MKPWMSQEEINLILKYLNKNQIMLEYGCGGSTLYFSKFVKKYYAIEHNKEWFNTIKEKIKEKKIDNINIVLKEILIDSRYLKKADNWNILSNSDNYKNFKEYIEAPSDLKTKFDVVLIDGRSRPECAKFIYDNNMLNDNGVVIVHDFWNRNYYHVVFSKYKEIDSVKNGQSLVILNKK